VLSVLLRYTDSDYPFGILWPLCCQFFFDIRILITLLVSFGHCVVCLYRRRTDNAMAKRYQRGNQNPYIEEEQTTQWPKDTKRVIRIRISKKNWITPLESFGHCVVSSSSIYRFWLPLWYMLAIVLSVLIRYRDSDYPFGILWPWWEELTTRWPKDAKGVIRICISKKSRRHNGKKIQKG
jgi:hypothetical protein